MYVKQETLDKDFFVTLSQWPAENPTTQCARVYNTKYNMIFASYYTQEGSFDAVLQMAKHFVRRYREKEVAFRLRLEKHAEHEDFDDEKQEIKRDRKRRTAPFWYFELNDSQVKTYFPSYRHR